MLKFKAYHKPSNMLIDWETLKKTILIGNEMQVYRNANEKDMCNPAFLYSIRLSPHGFLLSNDIVILLYTPLQDDYGNQICQGDIIDSSTPFIGEDKKVYFESRLKAVKWNGYEFYLLDIENFNVQSIRTIKNQSIFEQMGVKIVGTVYDDRFKEVRERLI